MSFLARNIRFLRKQRKEKQEDISVLFAKKANTVGNWENRKSEPSLGEIVRLADHFGVGLHDLLNIDLTQRGIQPALAGQTPTHNNSVVRAPAAGVDPAAAEALAGRHYERDQTPDMSLAESPDSFWVLIRELRTIHEKLDALKESITALHDKKGSDKSQH